MTVMIIKNVRIWTNDERGVIENGFVQIKGDTIERLGSMKELSKTRRAPSKKSLGKIEVLDGGGQLLMPGLINCHTNLYGALARGMALEGVAPYTFRDILEQIWWRLDKALDAESIYYSAFVGGIDLLKNGVTTLIDHHASPSCIRGSLKALKQVVVDDLGLRASLCYETSDRDGKERARQGIEENITFFDEAQRAKDDRVNALIGLHASFTLSDETFALLQRKLKNRRVGYHIHAAEGIEDSQDSQQRYSKRVIERLRDLGILNSQTIVAHGIHLTEDEKDIIAEKDAIVVHNPQSNMNNAVGITDVIGLLHRGALVGLGNDGFGSNMLDDLKAMYLAQKFVHGDPKVLDMSQAHQILFENNYAIVKRLFGIEIGKIKPRYKADLILADYTPPTPLEAENFMGHLIFGLASRFDVRTALVGGKIVMRDGQVCGADEGDVCRAAREVARRLWQRIR